MDVGSNKQLVRTGCFSSAKIQIASYVCHNIFIKGEELLFVEYYAICMLGIPLFEYDGYADINNGWR